MKKFFKIFLIFFVGSFVFGQNSNDENTEIGSKNLLVKKEQCSFLGMEQSFSKSDIHFKGNGYDFVLHNVVAHDRPSDLSWDYINPKEVSIPQFNFRYGYFIKDNLAIVIAQDHMKYVMDQNQTVDITGNISDPVYANMVQNGKINLADEKFLTFEHTDGLNYVNAGVEKYKNLYAKEKVEILWAYGGGLG
jgi:hypothetical protein